MLMRMMRPVVLASALWGCTGSERPGQTTERWRPVRTIGGRTVQIDSASLTTHADTVRVRARVIQGVDTSTRTMEISCTGLQFRSLEGNRDWAPVRKGISGAIAEAVCATTPPR